MEKIEDSAEVFDNEIMFYFQEFCELYNVEDMTTETQNRFNGCMMYIGKKLFRNTDKLKIQPKLYNKYDPEKISDILNIYIELCTVYSKEISINGFSKLCSIDYDTIQDWKNPSCDTFVIYKRLMQENENSNSDLLASGKNVVGVIARLNHVHGWSAQQIRQETLAKSEVLTLEKLPQLPNNAGIVQNEQ